MKVEDLLVQALAPYSHVRVLALDPGETTGACVFDGAVLLDARQLPTGMMPHAAGVVRDYINSFLAPENTNVQTKYIVMESYKVYSWKAKDHAWQGLHTPRLIGALELVCWDAKLELVQQSAQQGKGFCTDDKLVRWGLWQKGERHARDAIRHAIQFLLFSVAKIHQVSPTAQTGVPLV